MISTPEKSFQKVIIALPILAFLFCVFVWSLSPARGDEKNEKVTSFIAAAKPGDLEEVNAALKDGIDINASIRSGWTALHAAAERAQVKVLKRLIEAGADVNVKNYLDVTPLHWAASRGSVEAVTLLIEAGADVNAYCQQHKTPLGSAADQGDKEIAEVLIKAGADVNGGKYMTPLALATKYNKVRMIHFLIKRGAKVNTPKNPPLHWAGKPEAAKALLAAGANVDIRNKDDQTALHLTTGAWVPNAETVKVLIEAGADVNARGKTGKTPLHEAIRHKDIEIVKLLLAADARMDVKDHDGNTPLSLARKTGESFVTALQAAGAKDDGRTELQKAVYDNDLEQVRALIRTGKDVNKTGSGRMTAVHIASKLGYANILAVLIQNGAKIDERDAKGLRPLHYAANGNVAEMLITAGAKVREPISDELKESPMYRAIMNGRAEVVRVLIAHKAIINPTDDFSINPLVWAAFAGRPEVTVVLLEAGAETQPNSSWMEESALHIVSRGGLADIPCPDHATPEARLKIAEQLIGKGADVNATATVGYLVDSTPLIGAAHSGHVGIVRLLLQNGADVNFSSSKGMFSGWTALQSAAQRGSEEIVKILLDHNADINSLTGEGNYLGVVSPLDLAENGKVRKLLLAHGGKTAEELTADDT